MADPRVLAFLGGAKDQWEDDMTDANKADRAALSTDPEKKAARQAKIGELWDLYSNLQNSEFFCFGVLLIQTKMDSLQKPNL